MLVFNFLFILFVSLPSFACELTQKIVSLSGPVSMELAALGLGKDKNFLAKSIFHPIEDFKALNLPGGIYLSSRGWHFTSDVVIFADKSSDLKKFFNNKKHKKIHWYDSRGKNSFLVEQDIREMIRTYTQNCQKNVRSLEQKIETWKKKWKQKQQKHVTWIFFLGRVEEKNLPELVMVQDGPVLILKNYPWFQTYPTKLSYVRWSEKILSELPKNKILIGLEEAKDKSLIEFKKINQERVNIQYPGVLIPGYSQLEFLDWFFNNISF